MLGKVKGFFFEESESPPPTPKTQAQLPVAPVFTSTGAIAQPHVPVNGKIKENLSDALQKKIAGTAYGQFQKISSGMKTRIVDSSTRCIATGASLEAQGITKDKILTSAQEALGFLNTELEVFSQETVQDLTTADQQFQSKSVEISTAVQQKQDQIRALQDEISDLQKQKATLDITTAEKKSHLEVDKINFQNAVSVLSQEINNDISDITRFMGV